jgi:predicted nucleic acid-binding protein
MVYFDTSFLVPMIRAELTSIQVEEFLQRNRTSELAISLWTRVEFSSLIARDFRMGRLTRAAALYADSQFDMLVNESFAVLVPDADDFELAKQYVQNYGTGLRSPDALHLAIANNHGATSIYTLDQGLIRAGRRLRLPVRRGIRQRGRPSE